MKKWVYLLISAVYSPASFSADSPKTVDSLVFPYDMPEQKPPIPLSEAVARNYDAYSAPRQENNELYSQFKYTELKGFDYHGGDGTVSRRDPSKVIFENGKYYVWYTKRQTKTPPIGLDKAHLATDEVASSDWDLAEIWYATSLDGFTWKEEGVAIKRPPKPNPGWRSVSTADILKWKNKYYLYYQAFLEVSGKMWDNCPVAVSSADSPDGPWTHHNTVVIPNGEAGEWDQYSIHDPYPLVHDGKIYIYYKSDFDRFSDRPGKDEPVRMQGLAIADSPLGPFIKHPLNPIMNSGHETTLFPWKKGVAALVIKDGNEFDTIQYAEDWVNFSIVANAELMPVAAGPYVADAFTDTKDGRGITWGISHFAAPLAGKRYSVLTRFDTDLSRDVDDPQMKRHHIRHSPEYHYKFGLSKSQKERIERENAALRKQPIR